MKKVIIILTLSVIGFSCSKKTNEQTEKNPTETNSISDSTFNNPADTLSQYFTKGNLNIRIKNTISNNQNNFYIYFQKNGGVAHNLKMHIQYEEHDIYQFSINGQKYTYKANHFKGSGKNKIHWYDYQVQKEDISLFNTLIKSDGGRILFSDGTSVPIDDNMKLNLKRSMDYYEVSGGQLPNSAAQ